MNDITKYLLAASVTFIILVQTIRILIDPAKYKEKHALGAVRRAFLRAADTKESSDLLPYRYYINWARLFNIYTLKLRLDAPARFVHLRTMWNIDEPSYRSQTIGEWKPMGDSASGLSGSLFFRSQPDGNLLLKSLAREFEVQFLHEHFLAAYFDFVEKNPKTLINKIFDVLCSFERRVIRSTPSCYLVLENVASDKEDDWEMFDLKPTTYLEPVRDLLPEQLHTSGVTDVLPRDKALLVSSTQERDELLNQLRTDTEFLASLGAVDYSVLLVRKPDGSGRVALIDVFWSLRTPRGKITKQISDAAGVPEQTVTASSEDYAEEVVKMMEKSIRVR